MSTVHSYFSQYCISHKTIIHLAAAAPGPEVHCECPMRDIISIYAPPHNKSWRCHWDWPCGFLDT